jgi:hypothetical protein
MGNLGSELDSAREDTLWTQRQIRAAARRLVAGVTGLVVLVVLFAASSNTGTIQNIKVLGTVKTSSAAPVRATVNTRITAPVHAVITGTLQARITAPITVLPPRRHHRKDRPAWHPDH